jgi:hypothetical protein
LDALRDEVDRELFGACAASVDGWLRGHTLRWSVVPLEGPTGCSGWLRMVTNRMT